MTCFTVSGDVLGYGERGLVNALVRHLTANPAQVRKLLEACKWQGGETTQQRLLALLDRADRHVFIVEPGFADFGAPDLILVLQCAAKTIGTVFVEAKVVAYVKSAMSNNRGMAEAGFNSSINGQLSLRYRLARALAVYRSGSRQGMVEPVAVAARAHHAVQDGSRCRHLLKEANLKHLVDRFWHQSQRAEDFLRSVFYLALTHDCCNPLSADPTQRPWMPHYFEAADDEELRATEHTGWIGWTTIEQQEIVSDCPEYAATRPLALVDIDVATAPPSLEGRTTSLRLENWSSFSPTLRERAERICKAMKESAERKFDPAAVEEQSRHGSLTLTVEGRAVAKVIPRHLGGEEQILIGLADDQGVTVPPRFSAAAETIRGRRFRFLEAGGSAGPILTADVADAIDEYFANLADAR